jgi:hypothetical protein
LCNQVARWIRYFQKTNSDGRAQLADVHEALGIQLALIAGGGYSETERQLSPEVRDAVNTRDGGICQSCGAPGTDIDHIDGSSADLSNLQLLCQSAMVVAEQSIVETVHRPIIRRAAETPNRQPCDWVDWQHGRWTKGAKEVSEKLRAVWSSWLAGPGSSPVNPVIAVAGFPAHLDAWAWYLGERPKAASQSEAWRARVLRGGPSITIREPLDPEAAARQEAVREANRKFREEYEKRMAAAALRTIVHSRPFRSPITGKGKWHTSYADVPDSEIPPWVTDPARVPACGSRTVELDPGTETFYPPVGEKRSLITDRLCGNCVRIE